MYIYSFEKLDVWQLSREFTKEIYLLTKKFPDDEKFGLVNQIRRASISICSNIAEGVSRRTDKDKARFTGISYGSAVEILNQLIISNDLNYISEEELLSFRLKIEEITKRLNKLYLSQTKTS